MISRQRDGVVLAPLASNLSDVASHLAAEQRRRRRVFTQSRTGFEANANVSFVPKSSAAIRRRRDRTRFVAGTVRRRLDRGRNPRSASDLSVARSWPSKCYECSSAFGRNGLPSYERSGPRSGNEAGGSIQAAILEATRARYAILNLAAR
jgi:hypothetical protein